MTTSWNLERKGRRNVKFNGEIIAIEESPHWNNRWYSFTMFKTAKNGTWILQSIHLSNYHNERTYHDVWISTEGEPIEHIDGFNEISETFKEECIEAGFMGFCEEVE